MLSNSAACRASTLASVTGLLNASLKLSRLRNCGDWPAATISAEPGGKARTELKIVKGSGTLPYRPPRVAHRHGVRHLKPFPERSARTRRCATRRSAPLYLDPGLKPVRSQGALLRKPVAISAYFAIPLCIAQRLAGRSTRPRCANDRLCNGTEAI